MSKSDPRAFLELNTNAAMTWKLVETHFLRACLQIANLRKTISEFQLSSQPGDAPLQRAGLRHGSSSIQA